MINSSDALKHIYVVGITGPTGAGKTDVAGVFADQGFYVVYTDLLAREVAASGSDCLRELTDSFSRKILRADGSLDRAALARIAFSDKASTKRLNSITHPYIIAMSERILRQQAEKGARAAVIDAPLLFESGADRLCDITVAVTADYGIRLARIMSRDGIDESAARARMSAQQDMEYYQSRAHETLDGNLPAETLRRNAQILARRIWEECP